MFKGELRMIGAMNILENYFDNENVRKEYFITIVGCGRMGLPTAVMYANAGFRVFCLDSDTHVVNQINKGISAFPEKEVLNNLKRNVEKGMIRATTDFKKSILESDIIVLAIDSQIDKRHRADFSNIVNCCKSIGLNLRPGTLFIVQSSLIPGITETLIRETLETSSGMKAGSEFGLAYSAIRAMVGSVIEDATYYDRVISAIDKGSLTAAREVLKTVTKGNLIEVKNIRTAEATKLFENIYRDTNIALANELAQLCEKSGIDYLEVQRAANTQPYCHLLKPGLVGGHIKKDVHQLINEADNLKVKLRLTTTSRRTNDEMVKHAYELVKKALHYCDRPVKRSKVAVLGISYRPDIKDSEGSLVPNLVKLLKKRGSKISVSDPFYKYKEILEMGYPTERSFKKIIEKADCLLISVGHSKYKDIKLKTIKVLMKKPAAIVDLDRVINFEDAQQEGFVYVGMGRGDSLSG